MKSQVRPFNPKQLRFALAKQTVLKNQHIRQYNAYQAESAQSID